MLKRNFYKNNRNKNNVSCQIIPPFENFALYISILWNCCGYLWEVPYFINKKQNFRKYK